MKQVIIHFKEWKSMNTKLLKHIDNLEPIN